MPSSTPSTILVADDQADVLKALRMLLEDAGYAVRTADSPAKVVTQLEKLPADLLLMDLNYARDTTSGDEGVELIRRVKQLDDELPVVVMTAFGSVDVAVRVMREGARDFVEKPWDNYRLLSVVEAQLALTRARSRARALEDSLSSKARPSLIAGSRAMREVTSLVDRVAASDATVLITGENGVGKGLLASVIHAASERADRPLLTVDMGTLSGGLAESELFGHEPGAFTDAKGRRIGRFELADGATLFLDEIANCPLDQQAKLLRVIETGEFERLGSSRTRQTNVRLLCATNADLTDEVSGGRFRRDLYFRLNTVEIRIPPLRERPEDIEALADLFLERSNAKYRRSIQGFSGRARTRLARYAWPGNVRELAHSIERAVLLAEGSDIDEPDLRLERAATDATGGDLEAMTLEQAERVLIQRALDRCGGNVKSAADALGLSRSAMYRRLERHEIRTDEAEP